MFGRSWRRSRAIPTEAHARVPVDRVPGPLGRAAAGVLQRPDRPEPEDASGRSRSRGPKAGAAGATRSRRAVCSGRGRPTSSAVRSREAPTSCGGSCTSRAPSCSRSRSSSCSRCSVSPVRPGGRPRRSIRPVGGPGVRSSPRPGGCIGAGIGLFLGIGLLLVPISLVVALLQSLMLKTSSVLGISTEGQGAGLLVLLLVGLGAALTLLAIGLVQAATTRALVEIAHGRPVGPVGAYRLAARRRVAAARRARDRGGRGRAARQLALPDPGRDLARRSLGADRAGDRARAALGRCRRCGAAAASFGATG